MLSLILALEGTPIAVALISTAGVVATGWFGYKGLSSKIATLDNNNTSQHGVNVDALNKLKKAIDLHGLKLDSLHVQVQAMVTADRYMVFRSTKDGQLIEANAAALAFLGLPYEVLAASHGSPSWIDLVHEDDKGRVAAHWSQSLALQEPSPLISYRHVHPHTRNVTWVDAALSPLRDAEGHVVEWISVIVPHKDGVSHVPSQELV